MQQPLSLDYMKIKYLRFFPTFRANPDKRNTDAVDDEAALFSRLLTQSLLVHVDIDDAVAFFATNMGMGSCIIIIAMGILCALQDLDNANFGKDFHRLVDRSQTHRRIIGL